MTRILGLLAALAMAGTVGSGWAQAPASSSQATPATGPASAPAASTTTCQDTGRFDPPQVPWMGRMVFQVTLTHQAGQVLDAQVKSVRPLDTGSDWALTQALSQHVKAHLRCQGPESPTTIYLAVNLTHDLPALTKAWETSGNGQSTPLPATFTDSAQACPTMKRPEVPSFNFGGVWHLHALAVVRQGKVVYTDIKLLRGDPKKPAANRAFIKAVDHALLHRYECAGDHVLEQEFVFNIAD